MNKRLCVLGAVLLCSVSSAALAQQLTGPYITGGVGGSFPLTEQSTGPSPQNSTSVTYNAGLASSLAAGYEFGNGFRAEVQLGAATNNMDNVDHGALPKGGHVQTYDLFGNVLYDFYGYGLPVVPHIGAGIGEISVRNSGVATPDAPINGHSSVFGYQAIVGAEYPLAQNLKLGLDYRFIGSQDTDINETFGGVASTAHYKYYSHNVFVTLRVEFGDLPAAPAALPAVVPPPPAQAAKAPEVQRAFQVFFDFNKSDITAAAAKVIQQATDSVKAGHLTQINVTGHTDTVGSAKYNQALSERRAAAVKAQLISDGVPSSEIATSGVGKTGLLVPTADGVREPQNRRAEIVLH
ncbi:MAG TPA: OmpA family protein [Aliidongia sp.]|uniref:OmpA family protein n=1 Tax=Aliidongia sp. TaxID=1914230 RepID=UPI002DDD3118|nr:OmpA family protein [Aliidongia sp.]HEV2678167.1 OmpA family protein [Aliidongia sp.]